jgi:hypothetical protein
MFILCLLLLIVILFYFHLSAQFKKPREPFEIYETIYESREQLDILNSHKQPFLFDIEPLCPLTFTTSLAELDTIVSLMDMSSFYDSHHSTPHSKHILELPLKGCMSLTTHLPNYNCFGYIQYHNEDATVWQTIIDEFDDILMPKSAINYHKLGIMFGSTNSHNVPEYHTQTAKYIVVLSGEITVKLTSVRNCERLNGGKFKQKMISPSNSHFTQFYCDGVNLWDPQNIKLKKIPFLEFNISSGIALSIPSFTVWSISYNTPDTIVFTVDYISFINSIANVFNWFKYRKPIDDNIDCESDNDSENDVKNDVDNNEQTLKGEIEHNEETIDDNVDDTKI